MLQYKKLISSGKQLGQLLTPNIVITSPNKYGGQIIG